MIVYRLLQLFTALTPTSGRIFYKAEGLMLKAEGLSPKFIKPE